LRSYSGIPSIEGYKLQVVDSSSALPLAQKKILTIMSLKQKIIFSDLNYRIWGRLVGYYNGKNEIYFFTYYFANNTTKIFDA
jgi:hypothetical protein